MKPNIHQPKAPEAKAVTKAAAKSDAKDDLKSLPMPPMTDNTHPVGAKPSFLTTLPRKLERPMLLLSFVWFLVIIIPAVSEFVTSR
jgi:hypothetical protein